MRLARSETRPVPLDDQWVSSLQPQTIKLAIEEFDFVNVIQSKTLRSHVCDPQEVMGIVLRAASLLLLNATLNLEQTLATARGSPSRHSAPGPPFHRSEAALPEAFRYEGRGVEAGGGLRGSTCGAAQQGEEAGAGSV